MNAFENVNWPIPARPDGYVPLEYRELAVLMDIRREIQNLVKQYKALNDQQDEVAA